MPELPEVDAITGVVARHLVGRSIVRADVLRGEYLDTKVPEGGPTQTVWLAMPVSRVFRLGKRIVFEEAGDPFQSVVSHMMMTGYYDWQHEPWSFDYVEGAREPDESDVRVRFMLDDGKVLRFHDTRLFGLMDLYQGSPEQEAPELMVAPHMKPGARVITLKEFAEGVYSTDRPIKDLLMDQRFIGGIGNIYSNEALLVSGIDPRTPSNRVYGRLVPILLESLRTCVSASIPTVRYDWLNSYRRKRCGLCSTEIQRVEVKGRATFVCSQCQSL